MGPKWVKNAFSNGDRRPFGMLRQVFLAHFEPIGTGFGPWKSQYSLKRGRFVSKNRSKVGQKHIFPKAILDHWGCTNKCFEPILSPF